LRPSADPGVGRSRVVDGLEWVEPGFVSVPLWRPDRPEGVTVLHDSAPLDHFGGVARKP
jgi:hypothetical protein